MTTMRRIAAVLALLLVVTACGDDQPAGELPPAPGDSAVSGPAAGACLAGEPDCRDTFVDGEPMVAPPPDHGNGSDLPGVEEATIAEALEIGGPVALSGFYVDSGDGPRLCEVLAESFPPQCGGESIPLADVSPVDPESIRTKGATSWSDDPVHVVGAVIAGVLVPAAIAG